ncbi:ABC transporter ATP-binding protein [Rhodosalinus sp.]|uniref:ABC transporter ATP-binding protein n=1 Tax=Rhodosalinus sp. TaxID=2047741 RepID=UPI00356881F5
MIELRNVTKVFVLNGRRKVIADGINALFPRGKAVAVLGRNGAGKSSMLKMISGSMDPDSGEVVTHGTVSWPVGFAGSFHPELTGVQNTRFIARVYGVDSDELTRFVGDFAELGAHFELPVRSYSSGMKSRLAFGVSMGIHFDTYLVDEVTAVGDASFKSKSERLFKKRLQNSGAVVVTHQPGQVRRLCDRAGVLEKGQLHMYDDVEDALAHHKSLMQGRAP